MKMRNSSFILIILCLCFASCKTTKRTTKKDSNIDLLKEMMIGSFNSEEQSKMDTTFYNISLHMYPIWQDKGDFLYVEQALNSNQGKPYRQRIYKLEKLDSDKFISLVYKLENEEEFIGKWKQPTYFNQYDESILEEREGCGVVLTKDSSQRFKGSTVGKECKSTLRGATYATSVVEISSQKIISWDQGFDDNGEQVWGAETAGYIFDRITN